MSEQRPTGDQIVRTQSGLLVPCSPVDPARELEARFMAEAENEATQLAEWARSWERAGQPPLQVLDIRQACVVRSQVYLWPVAFMKAVAARTISLLGLDQAPPSPPQGETRQQRRARERRQGRAVLRTVPAPPSTARDLIDPNGDGSGGAA